jgi:nucleoside-diphosphate-sugar epimerase
MNIRPKSLPQKSLDKLCHELDEDLGLLEGEILTLFGGTGFIGSWLTSVLGNAIQQGLDLRMKVISRGPSATSMYFGEESARRIQFLRADISEEVPRELITSDRFIVALTPTSAKHGNRNEVKVSKAAKNLVQFFDDNMGYLRDHDKVVMHLSSGAVYKRDAANRRPFLESGELDYSSSDFYVKSKLYLEQSLTQLESKSSTIRILNPRLFAFYGPGLPVEEHFAIGNFMNDALNRRPIRVTGNPQTTRSYMHISDLVRCLIKLLVRPNKSVLNIGSSNAIEMSELALLIDGLFGNFGVEFVGPECQPNYYVPNVRELSRELGSLETVELSGGLVSWMNWLEDHSLAQKPKT